MFSIIKYANYICSEINFI